MVDPPAEEPDPWQRVQVPQSLTDKMRTLSPITAAAVANTILGIPSAQSSWPFTFNVPGDPPGTTYKALLPDMAEAPAVIYRQALPGEEGEWRVVALLDRGAFSALVTEGMADNQLVQAVATAIAAAGTISTWGIAGPVTGPIGGAYPVNPASAQSGTPAEAEQ